VRALLSCALAALCLAGCERPSSGPHSTSDEDLRDSKSDAWRAAFTPSDPLEAAALRLSLGELRGDPVTAEELIGERFTPQGPTLRLEGSGALREGLSGTLSARQILGRGEGGVLRVDAYAARGELSPLRLVGASAPQGVALPFSLSAGAEVRLNRVFSTAEEAEAAPALTPLDLPFDAARALALPEGVVVELPVRAQVSVGVNGQLLSALASRAPSLSALLSTSATGLLSGWRRGPSS